MIGLDGIIATGLKIIDKVIPDPQAKSQAQLELTRLAQNGQLEELRADMTEMQEVTKRAEADMGSDSWLAKNIRPLTLIAILCGYFFFAFMSMLGKDTNSSYVELLGEWGMLIMSFYFGGRTLEKIVNRRSEKGVAS